ncbi:hypothetical protein DVW87_01475 [Sphingomonas aracearum]|uniref:DUF2946 domain-containing protein n=2 Tax=Sphingomonas aracearum TaxID=2283317 RepID=A0A369VX55_9SPHN|nr:hypothetical protein DVW87_01475 [Sphingomonas aracearum]
MVALLLLAALAMRVVVPAGFMPVFDGGRVTLALCDGFGPVAPAAPAAAMPDMAHGHGPVHEHPTDGATSPCAFADLALPALGAADPIVLLAALAFVAVLALLQAPLPLPALARRLRPPLRGPPAAV